MKAIPLLAVAAAATLQATLAHAAATNTCRAGGLSPTFVLRQDFTDLPTLGCASPAALATAVGTRASASRDQIAETGSLTIDGLAALDLVYDAGRSSWLDVLAFGPFVQGAGNYTFSTGTKPGALSDQLTGGGFAEIGVSAAGGIMYFRAHGGELTSNVGLLDDTFAVEIIPNYTIGDYAIGQPYAFPTKTFLYTFTPELELQYDHDIAGQNYAPLFASRRSAARLGPLFTLKLFEYEDLFPENITSFVASTAVSISYHETWDVMTGRHYRLVQPVFIYNFGPKNHFSISAGYGYGNSEATGAKTSQFKVSLAAKF